MKKVSQANVAAVPISSRNYGLAYEFLDILVSDDEVDVENSFSVTYQTMKVVESFYVVDASFRVPGKTCRRSKTNIFSKIIVQGDRHRISINGIPRFFCIG